MQSLGLWLLPPAYPVHEALRWRGVPGRGGGRWVRVWVAAPGLCSACSVSKEVVHCLEVGQDSELSHQKCIKKEKKEES